MTLSLNKALDQFIEDFITLQRERGSEGFVQFDAQWPSPCLSEDAKNGDWISWEPVLQANTNSFTNVEEALDITLNPEFCAYFTRYYSESISVVAPQGKCELLFAWSHEDFERLQQNLIGHLLMKQRLGQPLTLFFAVTDEEDVILSVDNESGEVVVEQVGKLPSKVLASSLSEFISTLTPDTAR
ncbi:SecY-interacting protein [Alteromonas sp. KUL49]|uniref:SecY-interacting protein n=1 Tax=Alteromonas sp. KUL49 TaxID=2480798 RepID=UPI00102F023E|nr:SecY-interacting protein [Alteromonas sp. KUL49]TAP35021.1 SecY-interacting protein [Alteromonas sp. KUL49]GEA13469.1 hypothetical protein KUL49_38440 [Alteromonas sp. KUL49]